MSSNDQIVNILERHCASLASEISTAGEKFARSMLVPERYGEIVREVTEIVHRINGSSGTLGFRSLSSAAGKFEYALNESMAADEAPNEAEIRRLHGLFIEMQKVGLQTRPEKSRLYDFDPAQLALSLPS